MDLTSGRSSSALLVVLLLCPAARAFQQNGPLLPVLPRVRNAGAGLPPADLRVDVPLVLIPVHVTNAFGVSVTGLKRENFHILEDGVEQKIASFAMEDAPISVGFVFDDSGSMYHKIRKAAEAASAFFQTSDPRDEFFLIEFNDRARLAVPFTTDCGVIYKRIARAKPIGRTSLLDAVHLALLQMRKAGNSRKAIVILSDGGDNRSRYTEGEIKKAVREADVQIYAMGVFDLDGSRKLTPEELHGPRLLDDLAVQTGGREFTVKNLDDLPGVCARIGNELRNRYVLGYLPANTVRDGTYRHIKVELAAPVGVPPLNVYNRQGYYALAE
ncbi:MAG: VWA domain-containing protein [Bryobacteraceae bacterium]